MISNRKCPVAAIPVVLQRAETGARSACGQLWPLYRTHNDSRSSGNPPATVVRQLQQGAAPE